MFRVLRQGFKKRIVKFKNYISRWSILKHVFVNEMLPDRKIYIFIERLVNVSPFWNGLTTSFFFSLSSVVLIGAPVNPLVTLTRLIIIDFVQLFGFENVK